jgi:GT2 family glycosyltransferase
VINMRLSIIIVSWNVKDDVINCLKSIEENPPSEKFEVILVDNASSDGTVEAVKSGFPSVVVIANSENRGFAAANNQGIKESQGQYILLLNPDTLVHDGSLDKLINFMQENKDIGVCGPKLLNGDGTIQSSVRYLPTFRAALYRNTIFRTFGIFRKHYQRNVMADFMYEKQMDVDHVKGAAMMTRRQVVEKVDGMDEQFFMCYEEFDFCLRVKQAGWRVVFIPDVVITHLGARSASQIPAKLRAMSLTSMFRYFRKHRGTCKTAIFALVFKPAVILRHIINLLAALPAYVIATLSMNSKRRQKATNKIKNSIIWLGKYSWALLFRM